MCLYKRVFEFGPGKGAPCPITVHMDCRLTQLRQAVGEVTAMFSNGQTATGEVLVGADGINSATLQLAWPNPRPRRWTEVTCFRRTHPRTSVASLRKADGSPLDNNPIDSFSMDRHRQGRSFVRPSGASTIVITRNLGPRSRLSSWRRGAPDASHVRPGRCAVLRGRRCARQRLRLHKRDVATALLHYERVRHYRATRSNSAQKSAFDHLRAKSPPAEGLLENSTSG